MVVERALVALPFIAGNHAIVVLVHALKPDITTLRLNRGDDGG
jgi:hypothetical protein